jgi:alpha-ketoglutarate-dependent taurine dioxygenase
MSITITPVAGNIGAEIGNVKISGDGSTGEFEQIRAALGKYKVIFFRDQGHLNDIEHEAFGKLFGRLTPHPTIKSKEDGRTHIFVLDSERGARADSWHTDLTFMEAPPMASILRALRMPDVGGDTMFANAVQAYADLPDDLRTLVDGLWARHSNTFVENMHLGFIRPGYRAEEKQHGAEFMSTVFEADQPRGPGASDDGRTRIDAGAWRASVPWFSASRIGAPL